MIDRNSPLVNRHRPSISTVFFSRWILIDRRYRLWSIDWVDKSVDRYRHLDSCWDHFSPPMGPWLLCRCVSRTISHQDGAIWDYRSIVLFSLTSRKKSTDFFWHESTSTVDFDRFLAEIDGRCDIDRLFKYVNPYRPSILTTFSSRRILIDRRYRPYSQLGVSLSTVDIDSDWSTGRLKSNRPIDDTCGIM